VNDAQKQFLDRARLEAAAADHPFPAMAAAEAALESSWGNSELARDANNLFGMKQHAHPNPAFGQMTLPTREFEGGQWIVVPGAEWVKYPDWRSCFSDRLATLERLSNMFPHYAAALDAPDAETYVIEVSKTWSTDPTRAAKVISIYQEYLAEEPTQ
jgi:flagellum-specific peptidoglycan hydrolase FlgJ